MKYLLDTNTCIHLINGRVPKVRARFRLIPRIEMGVSIITEAELFYGSAKSQTPARSREKQIRLLTALLTLPFDRNAALAYGQIRASLERQGTVIGAYDMLIAATAIANDLTLVSHNVREFRRIETLQIEDWEE